MGHIDQSLVCTCIIEKKNKKPCWLNHRYNAANTIHNFFALKMYKTASLIPD